MVITIQSYLLFLIRLSNALLSLLYLGSKTVIFFIQQSKV